MIFLGAALLIISSDNTVLNVALPFIVAVSSARIARSIGIKLSVGIGILIAAGGLYYVSQIVRVDTPYWEILIAMIVLSSGMAMAMSPATNSIMGSVPVNKAGVGSAMNNTLRQVGGALGVAVLGTLASNTYVAKVNAALAGSTRTGLPAQALDSIRSGIQAAHIVAGRLGNAAMAKIINDTVNDAFVAGMKDALIVGAIIMAIAALATLIILPSRIHPAVPEDQVDKDKS